MDAHRRLTEYAIDAQAINNKRELWCRNGSFLEQILISRTNFLQLL